MELLNVKLVVHIVTTGYRKNWKVLILYSLYGGENIVFSVYICTADCVQSPDSQSCARALFDRISDRLSFSVLAWNYLVLLYKWWCSLSWCSEPLQLLFPHKGTCSEFMSINVCSWWHSQSSEFCDDIQLHLYLNTDIYIYIYIYIYIQRWI